MTPDELAAIEARLQAATPGPWTEVPNYNEWLGGWRASGPVEPSWDYKLDEPCQERSEAQAAADQAFVNSAREDVPRLVARIRELEADLEYYCNKLEYHKAMDD